jgi:hypothetical protein
MRPASWHHPGQVLQTAQNVLRKGGPRLFRSTRFIFKERESSVSLDGARRRIDMLVPRLDLVLNRRANKFTVNLTCRVRLTLRDQENQGAKGSLLLDAT